MESGITKSQSSQSVLTVYDLFPFLQQQQHTQKNRQKKYYYNLDVVALASVCMCATSVDRIRTINVSTKNKPDR